MSENITTDSNSTSSAIDPITPEEVGFSHPIEPQITPLTPKKFPFFTLISILIMAVLATFSIYLLLQARTLSIDKTALPTPASSPIASSDSIENWQTYTGKNYSIKYPKNWNNLESSCLRLEIIASDAVQRELNIKEYATKKLFSGDESVYLGSIKNVQETRGKYGDLTLNFPNLAPEDVVVLGPQGEGELNNIVIRGSEGSGYFHIIVWFNGDPGDDNTICNEQTNEYKDVLSTFKLMSDQSSAPIITAPKTGSLVKSPLTISGSVPSGWMFEGQLSVEIQDVTGAVIGRGVAKDNPPGSWSSGKDVKFSAAITFTPSGKSGFIVLLSDNPSGIPEKQLTYKQTISF